MTEPFTRRAGNLRPKVLQLHRGTSVLRRPRLTVVVLSLLLLAGCWGKSPPDTLFIGHVAPRSGEEQGRGLSEAQGILLAVKEVNASEGKIHGRPVAVIHPDAAGDVEVAKAAAVQLITIDKAVGLIVDGSVPRTEALSRVAQQYSLPLVGATSLPGDALLPFAFSVTPGPAALGSTLGRYVKEELQHKTVALAIDSRSVGAPELAAALAEQLPAADVKHWQIAAEKEISERARECLADRPGVIVFAGDAPGFRAWCAALAVQQDSAETPLVWGSVRVEERGLERPAGLENPVVYVTPIVLDATETGKAFARKYQEEFKKPPDAAAALAYDAARVLFEGMRRAGGFQGVQIRDALQQLRGFESLTGPLSFDANQTARRPLFVVRTGKGKPAAVQKYEMP